MTDVAVAAGMPLAINRATGRFVLADAAVYPLAFVIGLAAAITAAGFVVDATGTGNVTLADWTAVAGTAHLAPGQTYFLAIGGGLSLSPPPTGAVATVAEAVSPTTLNLRRSAPILL